MKLLNINDVIKKTSLGKTGIYARIRMNQFPHPIKLGPRRVAWLDSDIDTWINNSLIDKKGANNE